MAGIEGVLAKAEMEQAKIEETLVEKKMKQQILDLETVTLQCGIAKQEAIGFGRSHSKTRKYLQLETLVRRKLDKITVECKEKGLRHLLPDSIECPEEFWDPVPKTAANLEAEKFDVQEVKSKKKKRGKTAKTDSIVEVQEEKKTEEPAKTSFDLQAKSKKKKRGKTAKAESVVKVQEEKKTEEPAKKSDQKGKKHTEEQVVEVQEEKKTEEPAKKSDQKGKKHTEEQVVEIQEESRFGNQSTKKHINAPENLDNLNKHETKNNDRAKSAGPKISISKWLGIKSHKGAEKEIVSVQETEKSDQKGKKRTAEQVVEVREESRFESVTKKRPKLSISKFGIKWLGIKSHKRAEKEDKIVGVQETKKSDQKGNKHTEEQVVEVQEEKKTEEPAKKSDQKGKKHTEEQKNMGGVWAREEPAIEEGIHLSPCGCPGACGCGTNVTLSVTEDHATKGESAGLKSAEITKGGCDVTPSTEDHATKGESAVLTYAQVTKGGRSGRNITPSDTVEGDYPEDYPEELKRYPRVPSHPIVYRYSSFLPPITTYPNSDHDTDEALVRRFESLTGRPYKSLFEDTQRDKGNENSEETVEVEQDVTQMEETVEVGQDVTQMKETVEPVGQDVTQMKETVEPVEQDVTQMEKAAEPEEHAPEQGGWITVRKKGNKRRDKGQQSFQRNEGAKSKRYDHTNVSRTVDWDSYLPKTYANDFPSLSSSYDRTMQFYERINQNKFLRFFNPDWYRVREGIQKSIKILTDSRKKVDISKGAIEKEIRRDEERLKDLKGSVEYCKNNESAMKFVEESVKRQRKKNVSKEEYSNDSEEEDEHEKLDFSDRRKPSKTDFVWALGSALKYHTSVNDRREANRRAKEHEQNLARDSHFVRSMSSRTGRSTGVSFMGFIDIGNYVANVKDNKTSYSPDSDDELPPPPPSLPPPPQQWLPHPQSSGGIHMPYGDVVQSDACWEHFNG